MGLKLVVDKLEEIEEALRPAYAELDGKFHLQVDDLDVVTREAVQTAIKKANNEAATERHKRKAWEKFGKTPEEFEAMMAEHAELQTLKEERELTEAEKKGQWDQLKQQMNEKHQAEILKREKLVADEQVKNTSLRRSIETQLVKNAAMSAIVHHKGIPELLMPYVTSHLRCTDNEGVFEIQVVDAKGEPLVTAKGDSMSPSDFVGEMQTNEVFGRAFEGTGSSGSGMRPANSGNQHPAIQRRADLKSEKDRSEFVDKFGLEAYSRLPI